MKFRPCIDLHGGAVKQIVGGTLNDDGENIAENFVSVRDAAYYAELYKEKQLTGGHVIMLGPGNKEQALAALKAYPGGLQIGGGINAENAREYLDAGASHIIVTSAVFRNGRILYGKLKELGNKVGKDKIVLDLSCRKQGNSYMVVTDRWQNFTDLEVTPETLAETAGYCDEFLIHGVDVEGKQSGIEKPLVIILSRFTSCPITYAGGIHSKTDIETIGRLGNNRLDFTVGSALDLFGGKLSFEELAEEYHCS